jgi:tRNA threonylcarbamoyladenosine biosynthesis protein TsaE
MQEIAHSVDDMQTYAARFVDNLAPQTGAATIIALSGDLGAGKTTFTKGIARALGVEAEITSPTFVIEKIYALSGQKWKRLVHIDAYRLNGANELPAIGWDEASRDEGSLIVLEWPERTGGALPEHTVHISFEDIGDEGRILIYDR